MLRVEVGCRDVCLLSDILELDETLLPRLATSSFSHFKSNIYWLQLRRQEDVMLFFELLTGHDEFLIVEGKMPLCTLGDFFYT